MTLGEHLGELRRRLIVSVCAFVVAATVAAVFYNWFLGVLQHPYCQINVHHCGFYVTGPLDPLTLRVKLAAFGGLVLASPVILWQLWRFITPGLRPTEKRYAVPFVASSVALFLGGCVTAYLTFPHALHFLVAVGGPHIHELLNPNAYLSLILLMMVLFGATFEFPVVLVALQLAGVVRPASLLRGCRRAVIGRARAPAHRHDAVEEDRVGAELAGVLDRAREARALPQGAAVGAQCAGGVDAPQRRPADPEAGVEPALLVGEHEAGPSEVPRDRLQAIRGTEPDGRGHDARVLRLPLHLDQVLLAGHSVAMSKEHDHPGSLERSQAERTAIRAVEHEVGHVDADLLRSRAHRQASTVTDGSGGPERIAHNRREPTSRARARGGKASPTPTSAAAPAARTTAPKGAGGKGTKVS